MSSNDSYVVKVTKALSRALSHETTHIRKYYWAGKVAAFFGGLMVGIAFFVAFGDARSSTLWLIGVSALGGLLIGLSIYFSSSVKQWPVLKRFLNAQAVHEAARQHEL